MKLFLLRPINDAAGPWDPWYDKAFGFIVRALNEEDARILAGEECGDEGTMSWLSDSLSTCTEITDAGESCVIIRDFASA